MDIYAEVTGKIIEQMENGIIPWRKPWVGCDISVSHATGKTYSLLNQLLLGSPDEYATFRQVQDEGGRVKKGAKSKLVVFWTMLEKEDEDGNKKKIPFLKYSRVFSLDDCEGIKRKYTEEVQVANNAPIENAQQTLDGYISREQINLEHSGSNAFYRPSDDSITLPKLERFVSPEAYYDTAFHECIHSTGAEKRLNRKETVASREAYSKEELIAEIGSCYIMHRLGIETPMTFDNNVAYLQSWLAALKNDKRMIVYAASAAAKAAEYVLTGKAVETA